MSQPLPRLRTNLDFMPSPVEDRPGMFIRDPYGYSEFQLIIPPGLIECLEYFDGKRTDLDLREFLVRMSDGDPRVGELQGNLTEALTNAGFLEEETYARMKETSESAFREAPMREAAHAGAAYPDEVEPLRDTMRQWAGEPGGAADGIFAIAAPHVSPEGGWRSYQAAYRALGPQLKGRTFVVLGTSHYGEPERFGLTRKPFVTPFGATQPDLDLIDWLEKRGGESVLMEDFCHSVEHSIEFQVLFLQHLYGPDIRVLPVLCGSFAHSIYLGGKPEEHDNVKRFVESLGELADREAERLFWVLGIDMAHMGRRYGDRFSAHAGLDEMAGVEQRDRARIERLSAGDAAGFWDQVQENHDDLKWCGSSPLYTFLKAARPARGDLLNYDQWNIDSQSVVSFAGMTFSKA